MEQMTIKEIAKLCGVGVSTVSRAINNHPDINEETKNRILETIRRTNYVPNNSARNLKRSESQTIALLVKGIGNPFFGSILETMEQEIEKNHYSYFLQQVEDYEDEIEVATLLEKEKRLKGIIFLGGMFSHPQESYLRLQIPFVVSTVHMNLPDNVTNGAVVSIDDEEESCRMTRRLLAMGHRNIALLTAAKDDKSIGSSRLLGYQRALKEAGVSFCEDLVVFSDPVGDPYSMQNGYQMMQQLLKRKQPFTCVFAVSDTLAIGACKAAFDAGYHIPEDFSVAGFDGLDMALFYQPDIMTVHQPREKMAEETVKLLFGLIRGKHVQKKVIFPAEIREGRSVRDLTSGAK